MKVFCTLVFLFIAGNWNSQTWCAPGAAWQYTVHNGAFPFSGERGIHEMTFSHTLAINGHACDHITGIAQGTINMTSPWNMSNYSSVDVYKDNGVVYYMAGSMTAFDTLADLNMVPGQGWYYRDGDTALKKMIIADTGHVLVNGHSRRFLDISTFPPKLFIEGIGFTRDFFHPYVWHPEIVDAWPRMGQFRCYRDDIVGTYKVDQNWTCVGITGIAERTEDKIFLFYPNLTSGLVNIQCSSAGTVLITDILGKRIWNTEIQAGTETIDISGLEPGTYYLTFRSESTVICRRLVRL